MRRRYRFPVKGSYYYSAALAFKQQQLNVGQPLSLVAEPDNAYDPYALQIWHLIDSKPDQVAVPPPSGYLIGYVPRQLAKLWSPSFKRTPDYQLTLVYALAKGRLLRLECEVILDLKLLEHLEFFMWSIWLRQQHRLKFWLRSAFHSSHHSQ